MSEQNYSIGGTGHVPEASTMVNPVAGTKLLLRRSDTASRKPAAVDAEYGELFINYHSSTPMLCFKDNANNIVEIRPLTDVELSLGQLTDVDLTGQTSGMVLAYNGSTWVPADPATIAIDVDLGYTAAADKGIITNSAGDNATLPVVNGSNAGLMLPGDKTKLDGYPATPGDLPAPDLQAVTDIGNTTTNTIQMGGNPNGAAEDGARISPSGKLSLARTDGSTPVISAYTTGNTTATFNVKASGETFFADKVEVSNKITLNADGSVSISDPKQGSTGYGTYIGPNTEAGSISQYSDDNSASSGGSRTTSFLAGWSGSGAKTLKYSIGHDGGAEFAGTVKSTDGISNSALYSSGQIWADSALQNAQDYFKLDQNGTTKFLVKGNGDTAIGGSNISLTASGNGTFEGGVTSKTQFFANISNAKAPNPSNYRFFVQELEGDQKIAFNADGSASFGSGNITLDADGSITNKGYIAIQRDGTTDNNKGLLLIRNGNGSSANQSFLVNGSGAFVGGVNSDGSVAAIKLNANGRIESAYDAKFRIGVGESGASGSTNSFGQVAHTFNGFDGYTSYTDPDGTETARITCTDGSATFAGEVNTNNADGIASDSCVSIKNSRIYARSDSGTSATNIFAAFKGGDAAGNIVAAIKGDGSASFAQGVCTIDPAGYIIVNRSSGAQIVLEGKLSGSQTSAIKANGSASFAGGVTAGAETITSSFDLQTGNFFTCGAISVPNPTNAVEGQSGLIVMTGAPTAWGSNFKFPDGTPIAPSSFPAVAPFYVKGSSEILVGKAVEGIA